MNCKRYTQNINLLLLLLLLFISCSYSSSKGIKEKLLQQENITLTQNSSAYIISPIEETDTALIFYPGAYVEYTAYLPLMAECAQNGIKCILVKMPCDLAILNSDKAEKYINSYAYSEIKHWYLGGHSLGGAMAASYISKNAAKYDGLILLAAYSTKDLTESDLKVLSIYGSEDGVLNKDNYNKYLSNLPSDYEEHVITGGNHAYFGDYGEQKGDKKAGISSENQKQLTGQFIKDFVNK